MVELNGAELTEHEAELYDRQIRLWGLAAQKRLRSSRILICGLNGLGAEVAKNIILSGVKSVTFLDHKNVSDSDSCSQFLAPVTSKGLNRAVASVQRAQVLNPMVEIKSDTEKLQSKPEGFFTEFDVVVVIEASTNLLIKINEFCRTAGVKFFAGDVWGTFGYSFTDLQEHEFVEDVTKHKVISKPHEKIKTELVTTTAKRSLKFQPIQTVFSFDFTAPSFINRVRKNGPAFILLRILQKFRDFFGRDPSYTTREDDIMKIIDIRDDIASDVIPTSDFDNIFTQISPAAAIVGGELAQEIIKAISQKEAPHHNVFLFDPETCRGFIESIDA